MKIKPWALWVALVFFPQKNILSVPRVHEDLVNKTRKDCAEALAQVNLTFESFKRYVRSLSRQMIGKEARTKPFELELFLEHALAQTDKAIIKAMLTSQMSTWLDGRSLGLEAQADRLQTIQRAPVLFFVVHPVSAIQADILRYHETTLGNEVPLVVLVSPEYEPLFHKGYRNALLRLSWGGEVDFRIHSPDHHPSFNLRSAETVHLAGGEVDQCLTQTIASLAESALSYRSSVDFVIHTEITYTHGIRPKSYKTLAQIEASAEELHGLNRRENETPPTASGAAKNSSLEEEIAEFMKNQLRETVAVLGLKLKSAEILPPTAPTIRGYRFVLTSTHNETIRIEYR